MSLVKNWLVILSCSHLPPYRNKCFSTILLYYNYRQFTIGLFEKFSEPIISLFLFLMLFLNRLPVSATSYLNFYVGVLLKSFSLITAVPLLDTETAWQLPETELQHANSKAARVPSAYLCQLRCNFNTISCQTPLLSPGSALRTLPPIPLRYWRRHCVRYAFR